MIQICIFSEILKVLYFNLIYYCIKHQYVYQHNMMYACIHDLTYYIICFIYIISNTIKYCIVQA